MTTIITIQAVKVTFTQNEQGLWAYQFEDKPQTKFKMSSLGQAKARAEKNIELYWMSKSCE